MIKRSILRKNVIILNMLKQHLFANIIILLQIGACVTYFVQKKWPLCLYWLSGILTNIIVTYFIKKQ